MKIFPNRYFTPALTNTLMPGCLTSSRKPVFLLWLPWTWLSKQSHSLTLLQPWNKEQQKTDTILCFFFSLFFFPSFDTTLSFFLLLFFYSFSFLPLHTPRLAPIMPARRDNPKAIEIPVFFSRRIWKENGNFLLPPPSQEMERRPRSLALSSWSPSWPRSFGFCSFAGWKRDRTEMSKVGEPWPSQCKRSRRGGRSLDRLSGR